MYKRGFVFLVIFLVVAIIAVSGLGIWLITNNSVSASPDSIIEVESGEEERTQAEPTQITRRVNDVVILSGFIPTAQDFLEFHNDDNLEIFFQYPPIDQIDWYNAGVRENIVLMLLRDDRLDEFELAKVYILEPQTLITLEAGYDVQLLNAFDFLVGPATNATYNVEFISELEGLTDSTGQHTLTLALNGNRFNVDVKVVDTTPPTATLRDVEIRYMGDVTPYDFVVDIFDMSHPVTVRFHQNRSPHVYRPGRQLVVIVLEDRYGNYAHEVAILTVLPPPQPISNLIRPRNHVLHFEVPPTDGLDYFFNQWGDNVSIFYKNLDTGFYYVYNPNVRFFAASLSKANHALYMYMLAERGMLDMYSIHTYTARDAWGGTGIMRYMDFGLQFTTRELLGHSIRDSDNAAYRMLIRYTQNQAFSYHNFVAEIGADPSMIENIISQSTHAQDAGLWMYNIYNYLFSNGRYAHYFMYDLLNTTVNYIRSDYPIAQKYGITGRWNHDSAIVFAPSSYILVVLVNNYRGTQDVFDEISWFIQDFNDIWFGHFGQR